MDFIQSIDFLNSTKHLGSVPGLERVQTLMDYLGNPQDQLKFIHVTGTNGKGSTSAALASILKCAGYTTGVFSSPSIECINEEITVNGQYITNDEIASILTIVRDSILMMTSDGYDHPTEFEIKLAMAFMHFHRAGCDIVVLEVGLGGLGDATNMIKAPELAIFTPISLDHTNFMGNSIEDIAREKAGIIKRGSRVLTAPQPLSAMEIIRTRCAELEVPLFEMSDDPIVIEATLHGQTITIPETSIGNYSFDSLSDLRTTLLGYYQPENLMLAIYAAYTLCSCDWRITRSNIRDGISEVKWPGRFELISYSPNVIIDGAHNKSGVIALSKSITEFIGSKKLIIITGVLADKDYQTMMNIMIPFGKEFFTITVPNPRALTSQELAGYLTDNGASATACDSIEEAVANALEAAEPDDTILAFGSLYFIGTVRQIINNQKKGSPD